MTKLITKPNYNIIDDKGEEVNEETAEVGSVIEEKTATPAVPATTTSTFDLPTNFFDKTVNTYNNLSLPGKIVVGAGTGLVTLALIGGCCLAFCFFRRRRRWRRHGEVQVSYPLGPISPGLRRRR